MISNQIKDFKSCVKLSNRLFLLKNCDKNRIKYKKLINNTNEKRMDWKWFWKYSSKSKNFRPFDNIFLTILILNSFILKIYKNQNIFN